MALGPDIVVNGVFASDTDWTKGVNVTIEGGRLSFNTAPCGTVYPTVPLTIIAGHTYRLYWSSNAQTGTGWNLALGGQSTGVTHGSGGQLTSDFTATNTDSLLITPNSATEGWIDNISIQEILVGAVFAVSADIHNGDHAEPQECVWDSEQRWYSNAPTRATAAAAYIETIDVDFWADVGDLADSQSTVPATELTEITSAIEAEYTGDMHYCFGNHEDGIWGVNGADDWTDYEAEISQTPPDEVDHWVTDKPANYPNTTAYSFDKSGIHFVVLGTSNAWSSGEKAALITWLAADLAATSLPIVVFSHAHLDNSSGMALARYSDYEAVQTELEGHNVQAVIAGHQHPIPRMTDFIYTKAEIPYYHLRANCLGPMNGDTPDTTVNADAAFYVFSIIPNAVYGTAKMLANIRVDCYYAAREAANQTDPMDRSLNIYAAA